MVKFEMNGKDKIDSNFKLISKRLKNSSEAFKKIGEDFRKLESKIFKSQGAFGSRMKWRPLKPKTLEIKSKRFPGQPILVETGNLKKSLTSKDGNHIEIIKKDSIKLGSKDPKFKYHQQGTNRMTARPMITLTKYQGEKWTKIIKDETMKGIS